MTGGGGGGGAQRVRAPLNFFERTQSALFYENYLFVQTNVAVNTIYYVCPSTQDNYVVNSILTSKAPFLCPKHIAICPTTGLVYSCYQVYALDV